MIRVPIGPPQLKSLLFQSFPQTLQQAPPSLCHHSEPASPQGPTSRIALPIGPRACHSERSGSSSLVAQALLPVLFVAASFRVCMATPILLGVGPSGPTLPAHPTQVVIPNRSHLPAVSGRKKLVANDGEGSAFRFCGRRH